MKTRHHADHPSYYQFERNSRLRPWDFKPPQEPIRWGEVLIAVCICFALMSLLFFALQMGRP